VRVTDNGKAVARVDLAWPAQRVIVEVDGYRYHSGRHEWERDLARRNALAAAGWKVLHVTAQQLETGRAEFLRQLGSLLGGQESIFRR
jgi:very-short-patch-repair endonuclease